MSHQYIDDKMCVTEIFNVSFVPLNCPHSILKVVSTGAGDWLFNEGGVQPFEFLQVTSDPGREVHKFNSRMHDACVDVRYALDCPLTETIPTTPSLSR